MLAEILKKKNGSLLELRFARLARARRRARAFAARPDPAGPRWSTVSDPGAHHLPRCSLQHNYINDKIMQVFFDALKNNDLMQFIEYGPGHTGSRGGGHSGHRDQGQSTHVWRAGRPGGGRGRYAGCSQPHRQQGYQDRRCGL